MFWKFPVKAPLIANQHRSMQDQRKNPRRVIVEAETTSKEFSISMLSELLSFWLYHYAEYRQKNRGMTMQQQNNDEENLHPMHLLKFHVIPRTKWPQMAGFSLRQIHWSPGAPVILRVSTTFWIRLIENKFFACRPVRFNWLFFIKSAFEAAGSAFEKLFDVL